jgi:hypothetical protein
MNSVIRNWGATVALTLATNGFAAGNLAVSREITLDRSPATVWKLVGEFNSLDVWLPQVLGSRFTGTATQPGAVRQLDLGNNVGRDREAAGLQCGTAQLQLCLPQVAAAREELRCHDRAH